MKSRQRAVEKFYSLGVVQDSEFRVLHLLMYIQVFLNLNFINTQLVLRVARLQVFRNYFLLHRLKQFYIGTTLKLSYRVFFSD